jgi:hypothetical protein
VSPIRLGALSALIVILIAGCGDSQNRSALAKQTVQTYWKDVGTMKLHTAYQMLTPGDRSNTTESEFSQNFVAFLKTTQGLTATVGQPIVNGNNARVPVTLHSPVTSVPKPGCQNLFWQNGTWEITDDAGGLSDPSMCKK